MKKIAALLLFACVVPAYSMEKEEEKSLEYSELLNNLWIQIKKDCSEVSKGVETFYDETVKSAGEEALREVLEADLGKIGFSCSCVRKNQKKMQVYFFGNDEENKTVVFYGPPNQKSEETSREEEEADETCDQSACGNSKEEEGEEDDYDGFVALFDSSQEEEGATDDTDCSKGDDMQTVEREKIVPSKERVNRQYESRRSLLDARDIEKSCNKIEISVEEYNRLIENSKLAAALFKVLRENNL